MIKIPIEIGDTVYVGRFKNKKIIVKSITYNEYGLPMINGRSLLTLRIEKLMPTKQKNESMKVSEFKKLIREEVRKVIAENKTKSTKIEEGLFDSLMKAISAKVKLDGSILAKAEAKPIIQDLDKAAKGAPEKLTAYIKMAKQMGVDLMKNLDKVKEAVVYAYTKDRFKNWIAGSYTGIYDSATSEFSLIPASAGGNALTSESRNSMQMSLRKLIREEVRKVIKENNTNTPKLKSLIQKKKIKEGIFGDVIKGLKKLVTGDKMKFIENPNNDSNSMYGYYQDDEGNKFIGVRRSDLRYEPGYRKAWVEIYDMKDEEIIKTSAKNAAARNGQYAASREDAFGGGAGDSSFTAFKGDYFPKPIKVVNSETF